MHSKIREAREKMKALVSQMKKDGGNAEAISLVEESVVILEKDDVPVSVAVSVPAPVTAPTAQLSAPKPTAITPIAMLEEEHLRVVIEKEKALTLAALAQAKLFDAQRDEVEKVTLVSLDQKERKHKLEMEELEQRKKEMESEVADLAKGIDDLVKDKEAFHVEAVKMEERAKAAKALLERLNAEVNSTTAKMKPVKKKEETAAPLTATLGEVAKQNENKTAQ